MSSPQPARAVPHAEADGPKLLFADHHREIEIECRELLSRTYADDLLELIDAYRCFERAVLDHLAAEEATVLPAYAEVAPQEAHLIRQSHAEIRQQLAAIGVEVELHIVRAQTVTRLVDLLRAHAQREEAAMYPWAQVHLPLHDKRHLFVTLGLSLRRMAGLRARRQAAMHRPA